MQSVSINGIATEHVSVMDRGLQYGDGLFETIACVNNRLQFWDQHMQRMQKGAEVLGIAFPGADVYLDDIRQLTGKTTASDMIIKLVLTRGTGARGYRADQHQPATRITCLADWPAHNANQDKTYTLCLCRHPVSGNPALAGIKHLNRLDNVIARNEWQHEYDEGLMCDTRGNVIEGTMSNLFAISKDTLVTPALHNAGIDGIIRNQVLDIARELDIKTGIIDVQVDALSSMDELFVTNSLLGIQPVTQLLEKHYEVGETTMRLADKLEQRAQAYAISLV